MTFNGVVATMIKKDTETKIKVEVPAGAKTGRSRSDDGWRIGNEQNQVQTYVTS